MGEMKEKALFFNFPAKTRELVYSSVCVISHQELYVSSFHLRNDAVQCQLRKKMLGKGTCVLLNTFKAKFSRTPSLRHHIILDRGSESPDSSNSFIVVDWNGETLIVHSKLDLDDMSHNLDFF